MERILFLGESALFDWETLMIRERAINNFHEDFSENRKVITLPNYRVGDKKLLYFFMVLFDKIGSVNKSSYDLTTLNDFGLIDTDSLSWSIAVDEKGIKRVKSTTIFLSEKVHYYEDIAKDFMSINKKRIIKFLEKESQLNMASRLDKNSYVYIDHFDSLAAEKFFDYWIQEPIIVDVGELYTPTVIKGMRESISRGLYLSESLNQTYFDGNLCIKTKEIKSFDGLPEDISCILKLDLSPLFCEFPIPQNVKEVVYLRSRPEIESFREVFFYWCDCIKKEDYDIAEKIKKDILAAQNALARYSQWKKKKTNLLYCTIDALLGQIPYLSNILGLITPYSLRNTLKEKEKNSWVSLLR